jgi:AcrR family transcriptional regulator
MPRKRATPSPARKRRRYGSLSEAQILEAALAIVQREGTETVSMRSVAKSLGVSVMALYHHVPNKEALLEKLWADVLGRVPTPEADPRRWEEQLTEYAVSGVLLLAPYPALLAYGLTRNTSEVDERLNAWVHSVLLGAGLGPQQAALGTTTLHMFLLGTSMLVARFSDRRPQAAGKGSVHARKLRKPDLRSVLEFGVRTILRGLRSELERG